MAVKGVKMFAVESSNLESVGYNEPMMELFIKFQGGSTYKYKRVPRSIFAGIRNTESPGKFLNSKIRGKYTFAKLEKGEKKADG